MRLIVLALAGGAFVCGAAVAQTAEFKCPKAGMQIEYSDGTRVVTQAQDGKVCKLVVTLPGREGVLTNWYAPTLSLSAAGTQTFAEQLKSWTLWPLQVGKKLTGRYDGPSTNASYQGSWYETVTVDGFEKVTTKTGTYDVFVVTRKEDAVSHNYKSTFKQWYAPAVGLAVKFSFTDNQGANRTGETVAISGQ